VYFSEAKDIKPSFNANAPLWSATLETQDSKIIDISFLEVKWTINDNVYEEILTYLNDGGDEYIVGTIFTKDAELESHFWGCIKGASFTQKFLAILKLLIWGEPISITHSEEQEFEKRGREIEDTSGTGAFNVKECKKSCAENYINKPSFSLVDRQEIEGCHQKCVRDYDCGEFLRCNAYVSDGGCGIKEMHFETKGGNYIVKININPKDGKIITEGSSINNKDIRVIKEEGNFYSFRI